MEDCIFCKIVASEIPAYKIYEDDKFLAFLDIFPYVTGHTMVIPKKHYRWVWDIENYGEYMEVVKKIVKHFQKKSGKDMIYATIFGEEIAHAHMHIIPGFDNEELGKAFSGLNRMGKLEDNRARQWVEKFRL